MPYKLRKAPKRELYWVVAEDGTKKSKQPIPLERAKAQMRALYASMRGGMTTTQYSSIKRTLGTEDFVLLADFRRFNRAVLDSLTQAQIDILSATRPTVQYGGKSLYEIFQWLGDSTAVPNIRDFSGEEKLIISKGAIDDLERVLNFIPPGTPPRSFSPKQVRKGRGGVKPSLLPGKEEAVERFLRNFNQYETDRNLWGSVATGDARTFEKAGFVTTEHEEDDFTWYESKSPLFPNAVRLGWVMKDNLVGHSVLLVIRPGGNEYYDSENNQLGSETGPPEKLIEHIMSYGPIIRQNIVKHQESKLTCSKHSFLRACNSHLTNEEYNELLKNMAKIYNKNPDELVNVLVHSYKSGLLPIENLIGNKPKVRGLGKCKKCGGGPFFSKPRVVPEPPVPGAEIIDKIDEIYEKIADTPNKFVLNKPEEFVELYFLYEEQYFKLLPINPQAAKTYLQLYMQLVKRIEEGNSWRHKKYLKDAQQMIRRIEDDRRIPDDPGPA